MKKKIISIFAALFIAGTAQVFAFGIGVAGGYGPVSVSYKPAEDGPWSFAANIGFFGGLSVGVGADYWIMNPEIVSWDFGDLNWYWGLGVAANVYLPNNNYGLGIGGTPSVFIGLNFDFLKNTVDWFDHIELFTQFGYAPSLAIWLGEYGGFRPNFLGFDGRGGFRIWF